MSPSATFQKVGRQISMMQAMTDDEDAASPPVVTAARRCCGSVRWSSVVGGRPRIGKIVRIVDDNDVGAEARQAAVDRRGIKLAADCGREVIDFRVTHSDSGLQCLFRTKALAKSCELPAQYLQRTPAKSDDQNFFLRTMCQEPSGKTDGAEAWVFRCRGGRLRSNRLLDPSARRINSLANTSKYGSSLISVPSSSRSAILREQQKVVPSNIESVGIHGI